MAEAGYEIGERARPFCTAAAELLRERNGDAWPVQMLDIGCSYGIGSAFVKFGCSFDEMVPFFATRAPHEFRAACEATRMWLNVAPPACDVRTVGLDRSEAAIRFAVEAGLLDGGIASDLEAPGAEPTAEDVDWFRSCNLLISTGAIGYVTERTLDAVLSSLGRDHPGDFGPLAVLTILRMFDPTPIRAAFEKQGFRFAEVPGARLPQRRFADEEDRRTVLAVLHDRGLETREWEDDGKQYADVYVAGRAEHLPPLLERMNATHVHESRARSAGYIRR